MANGVMKGFRDFVLGNYPKMVEPRELRERYDLNEAVQERWLPDLRLDEYGAFEGCDCSMCQHVRKNVGRMGRVGYLEWLEDELRSVGREEANERRQEPRRGGPIQEGEQSPVTATWETLASG